MGLYDYLDKYTASALLKSALNAVTADVDKREGSVIFDTLSPCAVISASLISELKTALAETDIQTATGSWLDLIASQFGVYRRSAIAAQKVGLATPADASISLDQRFETKAGLDFYWKVTEILGDGYYVLTCETAGADGGADYGELTAVPAVSGLESFVFTSTVVEGSDAESDTALRLRYWQELKSDAYGGNFSDYKDWVFHRFAQDASGATLDGMMIFPASRYLGGGTVLIRPTMESSESYLPADQNVCDRLKAFLDPQNAQGLGAGIVPVGHSVTVQAPDLDTWDLVVKVRLHQGETDISDDVRAETEADVRQYFELVRENAVTKADSAFPADGYTVSVTRNLIERAILGSSLARARYEDVLSIKRDGDEIAASYTETQTAFQASLPQLGTFTLQFELFS